MEHYLVLRSISVAWNNSLESLGVSLRLSVFEVLTPEIYFSNYCTNAVYSGKNNFLCLFSVLMVMLIFSAT